MEKTITFNFIALWWFIIAFFMPSFQMSGQSIFAGKSNSLAANDEGSLFAWGSKQGSLTYEVWNIPTNLSSKGAIAGKKIKQVASGSTHSLALSTDGFVYAWGGNEYGELGNNSIEESFDPVQVHLLTNVVAISASDFYSMALKADGTVHVWGQFSPYGGYNTPSVPVQVQGLTDIVAISSEAGNALALKSNGKVYGWGSGNYWLFGSPIENTTIPTEIPGLSNVTAIEIGENFALALLTDGTVYSWGVNTYGSLGIITPDNETVNPPSQISNLSNVTAIAAGGWTSLALRADGTAWAWGLGTDGQLGNNKMGYASDGDFYFEPLPIQVPGLSKIMKISTGGSHSLVLHESGLVYGFGSNFFDELGTGGLFRDAYNYSYPMPVLAKDLDLISSGSSVNGISWENWTGLTTGIETIPVNSPPASTRILDIFEAPSNIGNNYGSRVRGYISPPVSGEYTFFISSDDQSQLWLSTTSSPSNKVKIAYVNGSTAKRQWNKYTSQKSGKIFLNAGQKYYIEALHKENAGFDHLAVAWQLPDQTMEAPINGSHLSTFGPDEIKKPIVKITSPLDGSKVIDNTSIVIKAEASYDHGNITKVIFSSTLEIIGEDYTAPYSAVWNIQSYLGEEEITAIVITEDGNYNYDTIKIQIQEELICNSKGSIGWEQWTSVPAGGISTIPLGLSPNSQRTLSSFEAPSNIGNYYGARIRGLVCAPQSGMYTFFIASDDHSELWLSSNDNSANKTKIAYVNGSTSSRQWSKYGSQKSSGIYLVAGQSYYIEALHKENAGFDNLAVAWQLPDGTFQGPISGEYLSPFENNVSDPDAPIIYSQAQVTLNPNENKEITVQAFGKDSLNVENLKIVILGSSTAAGYNITSSKSWVGLLRTYLAGNYNSSGVINLAVSGFDSYDILPEGDQAHNITKALAENPSIIIVNLPTNDVANNIATATTINNLKRVRDLAEAQKVKIFFTTTQPRNFPLLAKRQELQLQANEIKAAFGARTIEIYEELRDNNFNIKSGYALGDGIHLNEAGHRYIFEQVSASLDQLIYENMFSFSVSNLPAFAEIDSVNSNTASILFDYLSSAYQNTSFQLQAKSKTDKQATKTITVVVGNNSVARVGDFGAPQEINLSGSINAFPNPFIGEANINFTSSHSGTTSVKIYDLKGQLVQKLYEGTTEAGKYYHFTFVDHQIPAGIYICRLVEGNETYNLKLIKN